MVVEEVVTSLHNRIRSNFQLPEVREEKRGGVLGHRSTR